jgi:hypothetical protein
MAQFRFSVKKNVSEMFRFGLFSGALVGNSGATAAGA